MAYRRNFFIGVSLLVTVLTGSSTSYVWSQDYFGQNKVRYESLEFKVLKTQHFDIYYYDEEAAAVKEAARMAERWYARLSRAMAHELTSRQPLVLYASHPAFEQTTAIPGQLGEGTGGVTEALKRRVVLPFAGPLQETDHVLGHEIVHAFQYDMTGQGQGGVGFEVPGAARLPLWFIEGMAEYLSVGPVDPLTAMWLRDAVRQEKLPTIKDLEDPRFFPYRYGQALWSFIAGTHGDQVIGKILKSAGRTGDARTAIERATSDSIDELTKKWHAALRAAYEPVIEATAPASDHGRLLVSNKTHGGSLNVSPSISPDGKSVIFFSEKDLFSIEIFLADAQTGAIRRRITKTAVDPHFESLQFINSAGAWSPDSKRVAVGAISAGRPVLTIIDVESTDTVREIKFKNLGEIFNPSWSADGRYIAFSAISGGFMDLYMVDLTTQELKQLTTDPYADMHPDWSSDGRRIAFATERFTSKMSDLEFGPPRIAILDVQSGKVDQLSALPRGKHMNPQWFDASNIYFLSDSNGITNLYRMDLNGGEHLVQLTNIQTGIAGISKFSPAISVAQNTGQVLFSAYEAGDYNLYRLSPGEELASHIRPRELPGNPALLPPAERSGQIVASLLERPQTGLPTETNYSSTKYDPDLSLDYIAQPQVGVGVSNFGSFVGGGTALHWSDMLGQHNVTTIFEANNTGGNVVNGVTALMAYENQKGRWDWGLIGGQVPYVTGDYRSGLTDVQGQTVVAEQAVRFWQINREAQGILAYPFNRALRLEFAGGFRNISFDAESETAFFSPVTGEFLGQEREDLQHPDGINLGIASTALVYDQAVFGGTSPVIGQRYRFQLEQVAGNLKYTSALADYRKYYMFLRPLTLAGRFLHYGRYGGDSEDDRLQDLFLGYPSLIRGYSYGSFDVSECGSAQDGTCPVFDQLFGSRLGVLNLELRVPVLGPLGLIPRTGGIPPVEIAPFFDAAVAWNTVEEASFLGGSRHPVTSHGASLRINLLGFAVAQISLVRPNDRPSRNWIWEWSLTPGF